jgi:hypothetical protein
VDLPRVVEDCIRAVGGVAGGTRGVFVEALLAHSGGSVNAPSAISSPKASSIHYGYLAVDLGIS